MKNVGACSAVTFTLPIPRSEVEQFLLDADSQGDGLVDYQGGSVFVLWSQLHYLVRSLIKN